MDGGGRGRSGGGGGGEGGAEGKFEEFFLPFDVSLDASSGAFLYLSLLLSFLGFPRPRLPLLVLRRSCPCWEGFLDLWLFRFPGFWGGEFRLLRGLELCLLSFLFPRACAGGFLAAACSFGGLGEGRGCLSGLGGRGSVGGVFLFTAFSRALASFFLAFFFALAAFLASSSRTISTTALLKVLVFLG